MKPVFADFNRFFMVTSVALVSVKIDVDATCMGHVLWRALLKVTG
jgi:hypothetical protein